MQAAAAHSSSAQQQRTADPSWSAKSEASGTKKNGKSMLSLRVCDEFAVFCLTLEDLTNFHSDFRGLQFGSNYVQSTISYY